MKCSDIMTSEPACCLPSEPVQTAAQLMKSQDVGPIPIVDDDRSRTLIGIVTDRDLAIRVVAAGLNPRMTLVQEVMTSGAIACRQDDDVRNALRAMEEYQLRRIPVVDDSGRLVGIIAQADIATRINEPEKTAEVVEEISRATTAGR